MTICGWSLVFRIVNSIDKNAHIVTQKSNINYLKPIDKDFFAKCELNDDKIITKFVNTYKKHNKSRISLKVLCYKEETLVAEFEGQYVVFN